MNAKLLLLVGLGSCVGGMLRYAVAATMRPAATAQFPWHTLAVNVAGCFCIGLVFGFHDDGRMSAGWRLFLATGVLGGFTTFSAFSMETVTLLKEKQTLSALLYIMSSVILGLLATYLAYHRLFLRQSSQHLF